MVIDDEKEGYLDEVNTKWLDLARSAGIVAEDSTFLISPSGTGAWGDPWYQVRMGRTVKLAENLAPDPGEPEFLTSANDGSGLVGVTAEEDGIWLIVIDRPASKIH